MVIFFSQKMNHK